MVIVGGSVAVGLSDGGQINVGTVVNERNEQLSARGELTEENKVSVPVATQATRSPNGGLRPSGGAQPAPAPEPEPAATSTATSSDAVATSTATSTATSSEATATTSDSGESNEMVAGATDSDTDAGADASVAAPVATTTP